MPNKKRRAKSAPTLDFELEPSTLAKTTNLSSTKSRLHEKRKKRTSRSFENEDDTPKAFARLMAFTSGTRKLPNGLDNGAVSSKKRKRTKDEEKKPVENKGSEIASQLKIQPGETLREFNRRVDASLPISLKLAREPRKPKKKPEAVVETKEEEGDYSDGEGGGKRRRGRNKGRGVSPDPWASLTAKREAPKFGDVAPQPPSLKRPKAVLHSRGIADVGGVPKAAGSLARREGLAVERRGVVEAYRKMMEGKRGERLD